MAWHIDTIPHAIIKLVVRVSDMESPAQAISVIMMAQMTARLAANLDGG
jgi:hypothetical protein